MKKYEKLFQIHESNYKEIRNKTHNISHIPNRAEIVPISSRCMPTGNKFFTRNQTYDFQS